MTKPIFALALSATLLGSTAMSQALNFSEIDANGDGILQEEELAASFGERASAAIAALDTDGDGHVSWREASDGGRDTTQDAASDRGLTASSLGGGNRSERGQIASAAGGDNRSVRGQDATSLRAANRSERGQTASEARGSARDGSAGAGERGRAAASEAKGGNGQGRNGG